MIDTGTGAMVINHFLQGERAADYDRFRPYFHRLVFSRVAQVTACARFARGLDIACGTGQSSRAMAEVSDIVVGVDASAAMLTQARSRGVTCVRAVAEQLPLAHATFDLASIGLAFHWLDRPVVLREARRVLKPGGWLVVFNSWFAGTMRENDAFATWYQQYLRRFPAPSRHSIPLAEEAIQEAGFREVASERFSHEHAFTCEALVGYLQTQSNISAAIDGGAETDAVTAWLTGTLEPVFAGATGTFAFHGALSLYQVTMQPVPDQR